MSNPDRKWIRLTLILLVITALPVLAGRNPFARPGFLLTETGTETITKEPTAAERLAKLKLTGIIANKIALIDHQFYRRGDRIEKMTVKEILPDRVILEANGQEFALMLNIHLIKKTKRGDI